MNRLEGGNVVATAECPTTLHELFAQQVRRSPHALAVVGPDGALTYRELDQASERLATSLNEFAVGPDVLVGVYLERSVALVVAIYAVLRSGAAYVPIDPEYPADRIAFMINDAEVAVLLTQRDFAERLPSGQAAVLMVPAALAADGDRPSVALPASGPDDLAYVIYTSGSTGRPKGVMITHAAICNRLQWMQDQYLLTPNDRVLHKTPFSFDVSVWELFWPLLNGATMVVAEGGAHRDSSRLVELVVREHVSIIHFVPSMLKLFLDNPSAAKCTSLRLVFCSGEALPKALQDRFFEVFDGVDVELHNLYGPTEAAVDVTYWACQRDSALSVVPIGYPVANTRIHLLDDDRRPVPSGEVGRLFIGGVQVARGYLNRPELTAERFVEDPFVEDGSVRMYDTGDLARELPNGAIEFLGRTDHQVKVRGLRVELGEVEAALDRLPGVGQSVVLTDVDHAGDQRLLAYYVPGPPPTRPATAAALRARLAETLPDYMVPEVFVELDAFPISPSGKVDRAMLPAAGRPRPESLGRIRPPRDAVERYVATLWGEVLGIDRVGRDDRFFELGGTSLQAARCTNRLERDLGEPVFVVSLFDAPTVAAYSTFLREQYAVPLARLLGFSASREPEGRTMVGSRPVDSTLVAEFLDLVPTLRDPGPVEREANPPAVFILAPPRSGTTLLRVMLAGHPGLFSTSELQLLGFPTLQARQDAYTGRFGLWLDGTIRTLMELESLDVNAARAEMARAVTDDLSTQQFYRRLQERAAPRLLVDKSPSYALDPGALRKAERDFAKPFFIHLVRHPVPVIWSFEKHHMDQALYLHDHDFDRRTLAELVWTASHQVVTEFLDGLPSTRWHRIHFENLVTDPEPELSRLLERLGLPFHPDVLDPYAHRERKMIDGVVPESRPMGDTRFLEHGRVLAEAAASWRHEKRESNEVTEGDLGDLTLALAERLGCPVEMAPTQGPSARVAARRNSLATRRSLREQRRSP